MLHVVVGIALVAIAAQSGPARPVPAHAVPTASHGAPRGIDADGDGVVTRAEFAASRRAEMAARHLPFDERSEMKVFDAVDLNHDGKVGRPEAEAFRRRMAEMWRSRVGSGVSIPAPRGR